MLFYCYFNHNLYTTVFSSCLIQISTLKFYKRERGEGRGGWNISVMLHYYISYLTDLLEGSWDFPARRVVVALPCEASWELDVPYG
jgi:hypothetical protein